jgi:hypothetical protein
MRKIFLFATLASATTMILLASSSCTKKVNPPAPVQEDLTVVIGSVSATGDTTIYLQTVVKPH